MSLNITSLYRELLSYSILLHNFMILSEEQLTLDSNKVTLFKLIILITFMIHLIFPVNVLTASPVKKYGRRIK